MNILKRSGANILALVSTLQDLRKLKDCEVTGNRLQINHVFGCVGFSRFLVNLKTKATGRLVESIVKNSLGPLCLARPVQTQKPGEKFVPARNTKKRGNTAVRKTGEATIEREAKFVFGESSGTAFLLGCETEILTFKFTQADGLMLVPTEERQDRDERDSEAEAKDEEEVEVDVGSDDDIRGNGSASSIKVDPTPVAAEITLSETGHNSTSIVHYIASPEITPETVEGPIASAASAFRCRGGGGGNDNLVITQGSMTFENGVETPQQPPPSLSKEIVTLHLPTPSTDLEPAVIAHPPVRPSSIETPTWASVDGETGTKSAVPGGRHVYSNRVVDGGGALVHQPESPGRSEVSDRRYDGARASPTGTRSAVSVDDSKFGGGAAATPQPAPDGRRKERQRPYDTSSFRWSTSKPTIQHDRTGNHLRAFGTGVAASPQPGPNGRREGTHTPHDESCVGSKSVVPGDRSEIPHNNAFGGGAAAPQPAQDKRHEERHRPHDTLKNESADSMQAGPGGRTGARYHDVVLSGGVAEPRQPAADGTHVERHRRHNAPNVRGAGSKQAVPSDHRGDRHDVVFGGGDAATPQPAPDERREEIDRRHDASSSTRTVVLPAAQGGRTASPRSSPVFGGGAVTSRPSPIERFRHIGRERDAPGDGHTVAHPSTKGGYGREAATAPQSAPEAKNEGRKSENGASTDARTVAQLIQRGGNGYRPHIQVFGRGDAVVSQSVAKTDLDDGDRVLHESGNSPLVAKSVAWGGRSRYAEQGDVYSGGEALAPQSASDRSPEGREHPKYASRNNEVAQALAVQGHGCYRPHDQFGGGDAVAPPSARDTSREERYSRNGASGTGGMVPPPQVQGSRSAYRSPEEACAGSGTAIPQPVWDDFTGESPTQQLQEEVSSLA